ncbi:MAG: iron-sulfur cluster assembly accessory protein [Alphaproteobacteria bacterium]|nr:iron-sulfur cluster assembly accessory protein [Alphaproteobacteria bacterium]
MTLHIDPSATARLQTLRKEQNKPALLLRIRVEGGGCSGFQYKMELTENKSDKDIIFEDTVLTDDISLPFLSGATVSFEDTMIGATFKIDNPNAVSGCGCGSSFSVI